MELSVIFSMFARAMGVASNAISKIFNFGCKLELAPGPNK